ncbi:MAG: AAA family ATPase [Clostridia bacterium]|nr:AAA family ATPase [Clostridia bacterium]
MHESERRVKGVEFAKKRYIGDVIMAGEPEKGSYLNNIPTVKHLKKMKHLPLHAPVTFLVGENGTGKSTLLEAIAVAAGFNPEGGTKNFSFTTRATHSSLHECIRLARYGFPRDGFFLRAESFYNMATNIDEMDEGGGLGAPVIESFGGVSLHEQSHGESFLSVVLHRFGGNGLYILDEPEAALSPMRLMTLLSAMDKLVKNNSQFIISTHSPILMAYPGAEILELSEAGIRSVDYRETEHYQVTRRFLENPEKMLHYLLEE